MSRTTVLYPQISSLHISRVATGKGEYAALIHCNLLHSFRVGFSFNWGSKSEKIYLSHDAWMNRLNADILTIKVQSIHKRLSRTNELVTLSSTCCQTQLPLQIHGLVWFVVLLATFQFMAYLRNSSTIIHYPCWYRLTMLE